MKSKHMLDELIKAAADRVPDAPALTNGSQTFSYSQLQGRCSAFASGLMQLGLGRSQRVGIYLEKRPEFVEAVFGTSAAGGTFVPINPLLKSAQVTYILRDCNVRVLVTSVERLSILTELATCPDLTHIVVVGESAHLPAITGISVHGWSALCDSPNNKRHRVIDTDMVSIFYTSGSTGSPKGVVLSHRNMVVGATSVAQYLENNSQDTLLAALPLSFDAGFSQLTTAFHAHARVVLINYLMPRDVLNAVVKEKVTGLTGVPPLWIQLSQLKWPATVTNHLRYIANTGGRMPFETLSTLRKHLPRTKPYLMYGLTEAFRSTYLSPGEVDRRPDSIGKAIPNAEVLVLREDGTPCDIAEPGELVHRGALVSMGYWNDAQKTAERYKVLPGREPGLMIPEIAVFSGDTVRQDEEGFLYFVGRRDEMMKTSGYRVSPTEVEEAVYGTQLVSEVAAFGIPHPVLGHAIILVATPKPGQTLSAETLLIACREQLPAYMVPTKIEVRSGPLPRNANGKIDRKTLSSDFLSLFEAA